MQRAFSKTPLRGTELKNGFIKSATYEGMYENGLPNQALLDHHVGMARELEIHSCAAVVVCEA